MLLSCIFNFFCATGGKRMAPLSKYRKEYAEEQNLEERLITALTMY